MKPNSLINLYKLTLGSLRMVNVDFCAKYIKFTAWKTFTQDMQSHGGLKWLLICRSHHKFERRYIQLYVYINWDIMNYGLQVAQKPQCEGKAMSFAIGSNPKAKIVNEQTKMRQPNDFWVKKCVTRRMNHKNELWMCTVHTNTRLQSTMNYFNKRKMHREKSKEARREKKKWCAVEKCK